jgi:hypothetical protein
MQCFKYWLPKGGNTPDEWEDHFAVNAEAGRFAVADGATQSGFVVSWVTRLVEAFVENPVLQSEQWLSWLTPLRQSWQEQFAGRELDWFAEWKRSEGAFATFLGLVVQPANGWGQRTWQAIGVGDSCLFHVRRGRLLKTFPITKSAEFGTAPWLVGSQGAAPDTELAKLRLAEGDGQVGDQLWLMTDALAQWCLTQCEAEQPPWETLCQFSNGQPEDNAFAAWIESLRITKQIRNDDVTLLEIRL